MTVEIINLTINETTEARTLFTKTVNFGKYKTISKMWVEAILTAPSGASEDTQKFLGNGWYINKILVNGLGVESNLGTRVNLKMYDSRVKGTNAIKVIPREDNIITVGWNAPFGAGVISPHANITVKLHVDGETLAGPLTDIIPSEFGESLNPANITESIDKFADRATIPSIIVIVIIIAIAILALLLLPRILLTKKLIDEVS